MLVLGTNWCFAQSRPIVFKVDHININAGFNIGGVAPTYIPPEVRKINSYSPIYPISFDIDVPFLHFNENLVIHSGLSLESRSMSGGVYVENFKGVINLENTPFQNIFGYFTGTVESTFYNWYLCLPLRLNYSFNKTWSIFGGPYFSTAISRTFVGRVKNAYIRLGPPTSKKIEIPSGSFDLSDQIRRTDVGLHMGSKYTINNKWDVRGSLNYGLTNVIDAPIENLPIKLHNVFFNLSLAYKVPIE